MSALLEAAQQRVSKRPPAGLTWTHFLIILGATVVLLVQVLSVCLESRRHTLTPAAAYSLDLDLMVTGVEDTAQESGFQVGDYIRRLGQQPVETIVDYRRAINRLEAGSQVVVSVQRGEELVRLQPLEIGNIPVDSSFFARHLAGFAFLAVATWVALVRPRNRAARLFFAASLAGGLFFALSRARVEWLIYVQSVALALTPALTIHFFLTFPHERRVARSPWIGLLYVPSLVLMVLTIRAFAQAVQVGTGIYHAPDYWFLTSRIGISYLAFSAVFGFFMLGYAYVTAARPIQKRQVQWIMLGLACAVLVAAVDLTLTLSGRHTGEATAWLTLGVLPVPLAFAFAVLRYRLWDMDVVLSRSAVYGLLTAGLAACYLFLISILSNALGVAAGGSRYTVVLFVSALIIGILVNPSRAWIQSAIDRIFFRRQADYQRALAQWSEDLSTSLRFSDLACLLLRKVPEQLQIAQAWLQVLTEDERFLEPLSLPPGQGSSAPLLPELSVSVHSAIIVQLTRHNKIVLLERGGKGTAAVTDVTLEGWQRRGICVVLPLISGDRLVGIYLLGRKRSGDLYQSQELELLRTLANQAATAIANARLYEQVHGLSQQLEIKVEDRTRELRHFLSVVYHELSTPMTSIRGYTSVLLDGKAGPLNDRQVRYLNAVSRNVRRLMRLVGDLADVSRIEDGRLAIHPEPLDLAQLVAESLDAFADVIEEKGLQVSVTVEPDARFVLGDAQRIVQILNNLLSNACRYTPAGGRISVCATRFDDQAEVTVCDTGIGIPRDELERIFDRFYRSADPLVQEQPGTGLGLSITRSLVELHGSQLWVNSTLGEGSTFGFALRLADGQQPVEASLQDDRGTGGKGLEQQHAFGEEKRA
jgi:signal transduction histidine kinase